MVRLGNYLAKLSMLSFYLSSLTCSSTLLSMFNSSRAVFESKDQKMQGRRWSKITSNFFSS